MAKLFKLLANMSSIFKYAGILAKVGAGIKVAVKALEVTIAEIKAAVPEFKYLGTLESLLGFIQTASEAIDAFTDIFDLTSKDEVKEEDLAGQLAIIDADIKKLL